MLFKTIASLFLGLIITSNCSAHIMNSPAWCEVTPEVFISSKGVQYTNSKPRTGSLLFGLYNQTPKSDNGVNGIVYTVYQIDCRENVPDQSRISNYVHYDINGDVIYGSRGSDYTPAPEQKWYKSFFGKNIPKSYGKVGTSNEHFFLNPTRWKCAGSSNTTIYFYDKDSVRHYEKYGHNLIDAWICMANLDNKNYQRIFVVFDKDNKTFDFKESTINAYGDHHIIASAPLYGEQRRIIPDTAIETLFNILTKLK